MRQLLKMIPVVALAFCTTAFSSVTSRSKDVVVLQPQDLPAAARAAGQSMMLRSLGNGQTYLYILQQLGRIAILDVTDPGRIRAVGTVSLTLPAPFDFISPVGSYGVLLRYRDGRGLAMLNLKNPKQPVLLPVEESLHGAEAELIDQSVFLLTTGTPADSGLSDDDYKVVDSSARSLQLLATVRQVHQKLEMGETGTTFLLGEGGLTVVRRPSVELRNRLESSYAS